MSEETPKQIVQRQRVAVSPPAPCTQLSPGCAMEWGCSQWHHVPGSSPAQASSHHRSQLKLLSSSNSTKCEL